MDKFVCKECGGKLFFYIPISFRVDPETGEGICTNSSDGFKFIGLVSCRNNKDHKTGFFVQASGKVDHDIEMSIKEDIIVYKNDNKE